MQLLGCSGLSHQAALMIEFCVKLSLCEYKSVSSQVTFIYTALLIIQIVSKQLYSIK